jgi:hypothetical protein
VALGHQALDAGRDQAFPRLAEIEDARNQYDEADEVEEDDAAGEVGRCQVMEREAWLVARDIG